MKRLTARQRSSFTTAHSQNYTLQDICALAYFIVVQLECGESGEACQVADGTDTRVGKHHTVGFRESDWIPLYRFARTLGFSIFDVLLHPLAL
jgi:hypothetical protein